MKEASFSPPEIVKLSFSSSADSKATSRIGEQMLREGKVACLLVAGGQGTRLGINQPKGTLEVLGKSLFQRHAEGIRRLGEQFGKVPPFYLMTSAATHHETVDFFEKHSYFGLLKNDTRFFQQGNATTVDLQGTVLLGESGKPLENPDGHGGMFEALNREGILEDAERRGISTFYYFQVDNPLVHIADPLFLGLHAQSKSCYSLKIVRKTDPNEKLGIVCQLGDRLQMVEYSELPSELRNARNPDGSLRFDAGSIAIHLFDLPWLADLTKKNLTLPWHKAEKTVQALDRHKKLVSMQGIKSEKFIFDLLPHAERTLVMETSRDEFAPIKNAMGIDSLESAQLQMLRLGLD